MFNKKRLIVTSAFILTILLTYYATPYINTYIDVLRLHRKLSQELENSNHTPIDFSNNVRDSELLDDSFELQEEKRIYVIVSVVDSLTTADQQENKSLAERQLLASLRYMGMEKLLGRHNYGWHPIVKVRKQQ
jgi:hypothetical protein